jgi:hypothetical protein
MPKVSYEAAGKRVSGEYVVRDGTGSDGRATRSLMDDGLLSEETLAKTLLLQLQRYDDIAIQARIAGNARRNELRR